MKPRIGIVGCGRPGRGQARGHVRGYLAADAEIVALCDIAPENAEALRDNFDLNAQIYTDWNAMFSEQKLDMISVCLWPHLHAPVVIAAAQSGNVRAIHCEKPVAPRWDEAQEMARICAENGVQLTFNHQRRFNANFQLARQMIEADEIGELQSMEANCPDLFDWGTHWFDMMFNFNRETPAKWVLGQVETRDAFAIFGVPIERMGLAHFETENGVRCTLIGGRGDEIWNGMSIRVNGTKGSLEVGEPRVKDGFSLRVLNDANGWRGIEVPSEGSGDDPYPRVIAEIIGCLQNGTKSLLDVSNALRATELIFATYQSALTRQRVSLPLQNVQGHPLLELLRAQNAVPENVLIT